PASSPSVLGVGGTEIDGSGAERTWGVRGGAGGGGSSESLDKPAYQVGVGPSAGDGARDEPDVSALAGSPGVEVYTHGPAVGAAAPRGAAMWAHIDQSRGGGGLPRGMESL